MANTLDKIKLSGVTYDIIDATAIHSMDGYWTSGQTESAITAATSALAETIGNMHYQTSGDVQNAIAEGVSGKVDTTAYTAYTAATATELGSYADAVKYNSTSKYVEFYHGGTGGTKVFEYDASPFLIDGMVQNVEIKDVTISGEVVTCLVISFNTDAGKQDINVPISTIFDASNYYTKSEVDDETSSALTSFTFTKATNGIVRTRFYNKANNLGLTQTLNFAAINGEPIVASGSTGANQFSLQSTLVNQVNIKSINGTSLLGSGDLQVQSQPTVSGTTLVFS